MGAKSLGFWMLVTCAVCQEAVFVGANALSDGEALVQCGNCESALVVYPGGDVRLRHTTEASQRRRYQTAPTNAAPSGDRKPDIPIEIPIPQPPHVRSPGASGEGATPASGQELWTSTDPDAHVARPLRPQSSPQVPESWTTGYPADITEAASLPPEAPSNAPKDPATAFAPGLAPPSETYEDTQTRRPTTGLPTQLLFALLLGALAVAAFAAARLLVVGPTSKRPKIARGHVPQPAQSAPSVTEEAAESMALEAYREGNQLLTERKLPQAIQALRRATDHNPTFGRAFRSLGIAYMMAGDRQRAIAAYGRFVQLEPDDPDAPQIRRIIERQQPDN